jgi:ABC-type oligopeptide transport system substrate-binding subunit
LTLDIMTTEMADNLTEMRIMSDYYTRLGMEILQTGVPEARNRDNEYRAYFPHLNITGQLIDLPRSLNYYTEDQCPTAERRFIGQNRGCWLNAEFDRLHQVAMTTLDEQERANAVVNAFRLLTQDVGVIPMSYNLDNIAVRKGLVGPVARWSSAQGDTWNIHEWYWAS